MIRDNIWHSFNNKNILPKNNTVIYVIYKAMKGEIPHFQPYEYELRINKIKYIKHQNQYIIFPYYCPITNLHSMNDYNMFNNHVMRYNYNTDRYDYMRLLNRYKNKTQKYIRGESLYFDEVNKNKVGKLSAKHLDIDRCLYWKYRNNDYEYPEIPTYIQLAFKIKESNVL